MNKYKVIFIIFIMFVLFSVQPVISTEEYAEKSGSECKICHSDPLGGGDFTQLGKGYLLAVNPIQVKSESNLRLIRIFFKFLHILTAFMWFGTILYVHLILKPAYASKGLPPVEVKIGLVSMIIMALSGAVLTWIKVPSLEILFSSFFGIMLITKIAFFSLMVLSALIAVFIIGPKLHKKISKDLFSNDMTLDEFENCDGKEGRKTFIVFKGRIYDVSMSKLWKDGLHMKRHQAGDDLTAYISQAPHGEDKILLMPELGALVTDKPYPAKNKSKGMFYFIAYMNLFIVFIISFILALWR